MKLILALFVICGLALALVAAVGTPVLIGDFVMKVMGMAR